MCYKIIYIFMYLFVCLFNAFNGKKKMEMWFQSLNCDYFLIIMTFLLQINAALFLILSISCLYVCFCVCVYVLLIWGGCLSLVEIQMQSHANKQNINVIQTAKQNQIYFTIHKNHYVLFALLGFDCIYICFAWIQKTNKTSTLYKQQNESCFF